MWCLMPHSETWSLSSSTPRRMSPRISLPLILAVLLLRGDVSSGENTTAPEPAASTDAARGDTTAASSSTRAAGQTLNTEYPKAEESCAWWCSEMYGIIIMAASGTSLLFAIIMSVITWCLCRRSKHSGDSGVKDTEMDTLCQLSAPDSSVPSPGDGVNVEPPPSVGITDVENCTSDSEHLTNVTPQDAQDQPNDASSTFYAPAPENVPC